MPQDTGEGRVPRLVYGGSGPLLEEVADQVEDVPALFKSYFFTH